MRRQTALCGLVAMMLLGCQTTTTSPGGETAPPAGMGRLAIELVDAPNPQVSEINVTIAKVTAHSEIAGWVEIFSGPPLTVDLLKLKDQSLPLGFANLPPGSVTQIRLHTLLGGTQEVVLADGSHLALKVPSGTQSGIKVKGPFLLSACQTTTVTLDFDGHKSIWVHPTGQGDQWILRPVIHAKKIIEAATPCQEPGDPTHVGDPGATSPGDAGTPAEPPLLEGGGASCTTASQCLSGGCAGGSCELGAPGAPCRLAADCVSGACQTDGTCAPGGAAASGAPCASNSGCLSGSCVEGLCDPGVQGTLCQSGADCGEGFVCDSGACLPVAN